MLLLIQFAWKDFWLVKFIPRRDKEIKRERERSIVHKQLPYFLLAVFYPQLLAFQFILEGPFAIFHLNIQTLQRRFLLSYI